MEIEVLKDKLSGLLEEIKAEDVRTFKVTDLTTITDYMMVTSGTSNRHVRSIAAHVIEEMHGREGIKPVGSEGEDHGEWVLIDYGDVVVHVMQRQIRDFYQLEKLWSPDVKEMLRLHQESAND